MNLFAFIGEKITVTEFDPNKNNTRITIDSLTGDTVKKVRYTMDAGFIARYRVIQNVFNTLNTDTVEFVAYDHYGRPGFEMHDPVMLYISLNKEKGNYFHQKYQFDPVEKTKQGKWKGIKGESIQTLFEHKRKTVFTDRKIFKK